MKNKVKLLRTHRLLFYAITLTALIGFTIAACDDGNVPGNGGGIYTVNSVDELGRLLSDLPDNFPGKPYTIILNVDDLTGIAQCINKNWYKDINLDLSGSTITSIENGAFGVCVGLTGVTIGNGVTSIGTYAFYNCINLTSVTMGNGITSIGDYAFSHCAGLTGMTIPGSVTSIGNYAFEYCTGLTSVTMGNGVTSIGGWAFDHCTSLTSIIIPNNVTSIGVAVFSACVSLTSIIIPDSVTSIGDAAFYFCNNLTSVTFEGTIPSNNFSYDVPFPGDLRDKFYATDAENGTPGTYTTTAPVDESSVWTLQ